MTTKLTFTDEKKHSVRYDYEGKDFRMTVYVPKAHPIMEPSKPWPRVLELELKKEE